MEKFIKSIICVCIFTIVSCFFTADLCAEEETITVLQSRKLSQYAEAFSGFKEQMSALGHKIDYNLIDLEEETESVIVEKIKRSPGDVILAIGTEAALFAKNKLDARPVVFMMVLNPVENGIIRSSYRPEQGITGVSLDVPVEEQFRVFKKVVPGIKKIGMVYDKKNKAALARESGIIAAKMGLNLVSKPVFSNEEISGAMEEIYREADCLWAAPDPMVYNPATAQNILLFTLKNKIPFMAFSLNFVRAGALLALERDYKDIGKQTAEIVSDIFREKNSSSIPVQGPRVTRLAINMRTARILNIRIPANLQKEALIFGD